MQLTSIKIREESKLLKHQVSSSEKHEMKFA